jgi:hypothetical protein
MPTTPIDLASLPRLHTRNPTTASAAAGAAAIARSRGSSLNFGVGHMDQLIDLGDMYQDLIL